MSNCTSCQKKFVFLKVLKLKCAECEQYYCVNCIRKSGFKTYCETCLILNTRPVNKRSLMDLRSREVKLYLNKRKVSTENCIEKEELVNRFLRYVDIEPSLQKNGKKFDFLNGLMSSLTNSMPNLFEAAGPRRNENVSNSTRVPPQEVPSSSSRTAAASSSATRDQPATATVYNSASTSRTDNSTFVKTKEEPIKKKLLKLSDLSSIDEVSNLNVKNLKELLFVNRVDYKGCVEKEELTNKVIQLWLDSKTEDPINLPSEELCKVCMDAPLNSVLLECGHIATCINCGKQLAECPICRQYVVRVVHTFKA